MNRLKEIAARLRAIKDKAAAENRDFTSEELAERNALVAEGNQFRARLASDTEADNFLQWANEGQGRQTPAEGAQTREQPEDSQFRDFGEFVEAVATQRDDPRLRSVTTSDGGVGFMIPGNVNADVLRLDPLEEIMAPRVRVIPAGSQPDAKEIWPAMTQGTSGLFAGIEFEWTEEGGTPTKSGPAMKPVELNPHEVIGTWTVSNKVLRNASAYSGLLAGLFQDALRALRDSVLINGDGVGKPLGVLRCPGKLEITRNTASTIKVDDVWALRQAIHPSMLNQAIWLCASNARNQIEGMADTYKRPIFGAPDVSSGRPATLAGLPIFYHAQTALAETGDLALIVPKAYLYKEGFGPVLALSEHVNFKSGQVVFRLVQSMDGQCWLPAPVTLDNDHQVSAVAVLK